MSASSDIESALKDLQCHFTWNIDPTDIDDLKGIKRKLLDRIEFCPTRYHAIYFNIMAFVSHLEGENGTALGFLSRAEKLLEERKDDTELLVTYGNFAWVHYHSDNLEEVGVYLDKVEEITKTLPQRNTLSIIHGQKGWTFLRLGASLYERSRESFEKALEGEPENVSHNVGYAVVLYRLDGINRTQRHSRTRDQLEKALSLETDNAEVMVLLALKLQSEKRDTERAQRLVKEALETAPDAPQVTRYVAKYYRMEGDVGRSLKELRQALEKTPSSSFLHHQIGLCHRQQLFELNMRRASQAEIKAQAEECIRHFSKAVQLKPSNTYAHVNLAEAYAEAQNPREAERIFKEVLKEERLSMADLQHCQVCYGLFLMYKKKEDSSAAEMFQEAYKIRIQSSDREKAGKKLQTLAEIMRTKGKRDESLGISEFLKNESTQTETDNKMAAGGNDDLAKILEKEMKFK